VLQSANHSNSNRRKVIFLACALLPISFLMALAFGTVSIPFGDTLSSFIGGLVGADSTSRSDLVIQQIRMPRALLAAFVGALLGICGATTQGLFRNPLADPSLIGVTAGFNHFKWVFWLRLNFDWRVYRWQHRGDYCL